MKVSSMIAALTTTLLAAACAQEPEMFRAPVSGGELEYADRGEGEPVLFIHGGGLADSFALVIEEPALAAYRRINIYRRGYRGSSVAEGPFTLSNQAADVVGVLDALNLPRAHIVGHSFGGSVALQLAADAPGRIASLVLIEPAGLQLAPPDTVSFAAESDFGLVERAMELYAAGDREGAVESFFTFAIGDNWRHRYFDPIPGGYEQTVADADGPFAIDMPGLLAWAYGPDELRAIDRPTLMMVGGDTPGAPEVATVPELIADAVVSVIPGTDHALIVEKPNEVAEAIADFIARHPM